MNPEILWLTNLTSSDWPVQRVVGSQSTASADVKSYTRPWLLVQLGANLNVAVVMQAKLRPRKRPFTNQLVMSTWFPFAWVKASFWKPRCFAAMFCIDGFKIKSFYCAIVCKMCKIFKPAVKVQYLSINCCTNYWSEIEALEGWGLKSVRNLHPSVVAWNWTLHDGVEPLSDAAWHTRDMEMSRVQG